jgi:hypothetical protein
MTARRLPHLADRADIIKWADRIDARSEFPRLVRGLISTNNDQVISLQMRAAEGVDTPGYDGVSDAVEEPRFQRRRRVRHQVLLAHGHLDDELVEVERTQRRHLARRQRRP